jgi:hypothetical protein
MFYYLSVVDGLLEVTGSPTGLGSDRQKLGRVRTRQELAVVLRDLNDDTDHVSCSSSLDFPHEYTEDPEVIELCNALRRS